MLPPATHLQFLALRQLQFNGRKLDGTVLHNLFYDHGVEIGIPSFHQLMSRLLLLKWVTCRYSRRMVDGFSRRITIYRLTKGGDEAVAQNLRFYYPTTARRIKPVLDLLRIVRNHYRKKARNK